MDSLEFSAGEDTPGSAVAGGRVRRDWSLILLNAYVPLLPAGFGVIIIKGSNPLVRNRFYPAGPLLLAAFGVYLLWLWRRTLTERKRLQAERRAHADDRVQLRMIEESLRANYSKLFMSCQVPMVGMMLLDLFR